MREVIRQLVDEDKRTLEAQKAFLMSQKETDLPGTLDDLLKARSKEYQLSPKSVLEARTTVKEFVSVAGNIPYASITVDHVRAFKEHLLASSSNFKTKNKKWSFIRSLFSYAKDNSLIQVDPCEPVRFNAKGESLQVDVLSESELRSIFAYVRADEWWLLRTLLFTGARLAEIVGLRVEDIRNEDGVAYFDITPHDDRRLKTQSSRRRVPIHQDLLEQGLLSWLEGREGVLFKGTSQMWSQKLNRRFDKAGITDPSKRVHSLRHTFKARAREVMGEDISDRLTGHAHKSVGRAYGQHSVPALKRFIDQVTFGLSPKSE